MPREHLFDNRDDLISALGSLCSESIEQAVEQRGSATFMVSGGSTPAPLYRQLANQDLPWASVTVGLVDERWVPVSDAASNEAFIIRELLHSYAAQASLVGLWTEGLSLEQGQQKAEASFQSLSAPWDVVILGMGGDGHTASLFPFADGLGSALNTTERVAAIRADQSEVTGVHTERLTLTLAAILNAQKIILLLTGAEKLSVYRQAMSSKDVKAMPVRAVLQQTQVPVDLYWAP
ncbi:MAG: 6-phosphogluconolactonase [Pseudomonadales bacterium]